VDKQEASKFLKELLIKCKLDSNTYILMEPDPKDVLSTGYKVRIKTIMDNECRQEIKKITKKYDLAVSEEQYQIVVYKPKYSKLNLS
jgi:hypothetical protein